MNPKPPIQAVIHDRPSTLQFAPKAGAEGFVNESIEDISKNDLEIMTRELLQNSLDAGAKRVVVEQVSIATTDMPGHAAYEEAFRAAKKARSGSTDVTSAETAIVTKIEALLKRKEIPVLLFADDGAGITPEGMKGLLWGGNSTKGDSSDSGGSFGVGNRNAFKHSDLRYVCFASRFKPPGEKPQDICGGRTVLAAHPDPAGTTRSEEGMLVHKIREDSIDTPAEFSVPDGILEQWLKQYVSAGQTGSIIAVFGFNARKQKDWAADICRAAAKNFYEAIRDERLSVNVQPSNPPAKANKNNIKDQMANMAERSGHPGSGLSSGRLANSGYKTYAGGQIVQDDKNVQVKVRKWSIAERGSSPPHEVSLCRNGMWIARGKEVPRCRPADFADCHPFNATISVRPDSRLYSLVKDAEGPKHLGLPNFSDVEKELGRLLETIASNIRKHVGEMEGEEEWVPPGFAVMGGTQAKEAEKLPDVEPGGTKEEKEDDGVDEEEVEEEDDAEEEETDEEKVDDDEADEETSDQRTSQETPTGYELEDTTFSLRPVIQQGSPTKLIASVVCGEDVTLPEAFGVWVCWRTGSDASCDNWIPTRYMDIAEILWETADGKKSETAKPKAEREVLIPAGRDVGMIISLKQEIPEETAKALKIRVMRRSKGGGSDA